MNMVDALSTRGGTDIFNGIKSGIDLVVNRTNKSRDPQILFFTDG